MSTLDKRAEEIQNAITELQKKNVKLDRMLGRMTTSEDARTKIQEERESTAALVKGIIQNIKDSKSKDLARSKVTQLEKEIKKFEETCKKIEQKDQEYLAAVQQQQQEQDLDKLPPEERKLRLKQIQEKSIENNLLVYHEQEVARRHEEVLQIEKDAKEILAMFQDIQALIHEQQEGLDVISDHLENAKVQAAAGEQELVQAEGYQKKARKKTCCILCIFIAVAAGIVLAVFFGVVAK